MRTRLLTVAALAAFVFTGCSTGFVTGADRLVQLETRVKENRPIAGERIGDVYRDGRNVDLEVLTPAEMKTRVLRVFIADAEIARLGGDAFLAKIMVDQRIKFAIQHRLLEDLRWFEWGHLGSVEFVGLPTLQQ